MFGWVVYVISYNLVGELYSSHVISGRTEGRIAHWTIRTGVFVALYYLLATLIRFNKWVKSFPKYVWVIGIVLAVGLFILFKIGLFVREKKMVKVKAEMSTKDKNVMTR